MSGLTDVTAQMRSMHEETGSWRDVGAMLGVTGAYARLIALGERPLSAPLVMRWLGTSEAIETKEKRICPSCWARGIREVHDAGDCHGAPVAAVVTLAPGERVVAKTTASKPRPPCFRPRLSLDPHEQLRQLSLLTLRAAARCEVDQARFDAGLPENDEVLSDE